MDKPHNPPATPRWGTVTSETLDNKVISSKDDPERQLTVQRARYIWRPAARIEKELPTGFEISLNCLMLQDGIRTFVPDDLGSFLLKASLAGHAILSGSKRLSRARCQEYHLMRLLYQVGPHLREHLTRDFRREQDFYVAHKARIGQDDASVLPPDLGLDDKGRGSPWKPSDLLAFGRQRALENGCLRPDEAICIRFGLLEAAQRNPYKVSRKDWPNTRRLVRLALFDLGPVAMSIAKTCKRRVHQRLKEALAQHLSDDTDSFRKWLFENVDNVVHQIAKRRRPGGPIPREQVRLVLLEEVFRAYVAVGRCAHAFMRSFKSAVRPRLQGKERLLFDVLYLEQPALGVPLVLLQDRFDFLKEAMLQILQNPADHRLIGVVLRLLEYYAVMAPNRREADRRYKNQSRNRNASGRIARVVMLRDAEEAQPDSSRSAELFQEIAASHRKQRNARCRCRTTNDWCASLVENDTTETTIVLCDTCGTCGHSETVLIGRNEFERIGKRLRSES